MSNVGEVAVCERECVCRSRRSSKDQREGGGGWDSQNRLGEKGDPWSLLSHQKENTVPSLRTSGKDFNEEKQAQQRRP